MKKRNQQAICDDWNRRCPVGTPVRYYPVIGGKEFIESKTRSEAWLIGSGIAVVAIEGRAGGMSLAAIEVKE